MPLLGPEKPIGEELSQYGMNHLYIVIWNNPKLIQGLWAC